MNRCRERKTSDSDARRALLSSRFRKIGGIVVREVRPNLVIFAPQGILDQHNSQKFTTEIPRTPRGSLSLDFARDQSAHSASSCYSCSSYITSKKTTTYVPCKYPCWPAACSTRLLATLSSFRRLAFEDFCKTSLLVLLLKGIIAEDAVVCAAVIEADLSESKRISTFQAMDPERPLHNVKWGKCDVYLVLVLIILHYIRKLPLHKV